MAEKKRKIIDEEYRKRFDRYFPEFKQLYEEVYGTETSDFIELCDFMYESYCERGEELKALDQTRTADSDWYKKQNMLGMMVDAQQFAETLSGLGTHLDYLKECNVNYLHLMPLLAAEECSSTDTERGSDFLKIQPELGTVEDLEKLALDCHKKEISLCLDIELNDTSKEYIWARRAAAQEKEYMDRYFFFNRCDLPKEAQEAAFRGSSQQYSDFASGNFSWLPAIRKFVLTTGDSHRWDLNYRNPAVFNEMIYRILHLANRGIDVFRLKNAGYIWKTLGTDSRDLPAVHILMRMIRIISEIVCPGVILLGEVGMEASKTLPYFGTEEAPEFHMLYNVPSEPVIWNTVATRDVRLLKRQIDAMDTSSRNTLYVNYLRCDGAISWNLDYDYLRNFGIQENAHRKYLNDFFTGVWVNSYSGGELYTAADGRVGICGTTASLCGIGRAAYRHEKRILKKALLLDLLLHAFILTQRGVPLLYSGDEVCSTNDYSYKDEGRKAGDPRHLHRGRFYWDKLEKRTSPESASGRFFSELKQLLEIRASESVFAADADLRTIDTGNDSVLGLLREKDGRKLIAVFNFSEHDKVAEIDQGLEPYYDLVNKEKIVPRGISIDGYGFYWLRSM
ncbi:MAG: alpha-amylase family glycosyl hydrolase [Lachnospiraceae bacterium]|nr:alpha-amylase family glycosyl hydrolase [Lachnospiraceae bacterium]